MKNEIFNIEYHCKNIREVLVRLRKYNNKGQLSGKAKVVLTEKYSSLGYLDKKLEYYADEKSIKKESSFSSSDKVLELVKYFRDGTIEYKEVRKFDDKDRIVEDAKYHFNYQISPGKAVLGRNWKGKYDTNGNIIKSTQCLHGNEIEESYDFRYDNKSNLLEKIGDNYKWNYYYENDLLKKMTRIDLIDRGKIDFLWEYIYDKGKRLTQRIRYYQNREQYIQNWDYKGDRLISESEIDLTEGENLIVKINYGYDQNGNVLTKAGINFLTRFDYNDRGKMIEYKTVNAQEQITAMEKYKWNDFGLIEEIHSYKYGGTPKEIEYFEYGKN